jgi:hypothetical protein
MSEFKILALDGGGSWAVIQVMALINLYSQTGDGTDIKGHEILRKFDLVAANSGGALTLGGLIMDWTLADLLDLFLNPAKRGQIFVPAGILQDPVAHLTQFAGIGPKYSTAGKFAGLRAILGPNGDAFVSSVPGTVGSDPTNPKPHVVFCAFDYDTNRECFFRSDLGSRAASFAPQLQVTIAQAINASANPPVNYFDAPAGLPQHTRFWDGAVGGYNNPVLCGVIEALSNAGRYNTDRQSIRALSIGTGNVVLPPALGQTNEDPDLVAPHQASTILSDLKKMASSILDDPPDAATFHAHIMLGGPLPQSTADIPAASPIVRMNPLIQPLRGPDEVPWLLPEGLDRPGFVSLCNIPMDATDPNDIKQIQNLANLWFANAVPNQPIRANATTLQAEIGHGRHQLAKAAALSAFP